MVIDYTVSQPLANNSRLFCMLISNSMYVNMGQMQKEMAMGVAAMHLLPDT